MRRFDRKAANRLRYLIATTAVAALLGGAGLACAQDAQTGATKTGNTSSVTENNEGITEVTITAERRSQSAQKSALSVSVISGDDLKKGGISNVKTLLDAVPGLDITHANVNSNISLRGLGSGGSTQYSDPVIAFNIGGVPLSRQFATTAAMYDLQRVEVLKGPQGTLYGRNATVGALNLLPNRPSQHFEANIGGGIGNYGAVTTTGMINLPLSADWAGRFAFSTNKHDGYLNNGYDDANNQAGRLSLLYKPNSDFDMLLWADVYHDDSKGPGSIFRYVTPGQKWQVPGDPWTGLLPAGCGNVSLCPTWGDSAGAPFATPFKGLSVVGDDGFVKLTQVITAAELNWNTPIGRLTIIPAHVATDLNTYTYSAGLTFKIRNKTYQDSFEARLASNDDSRLKWLVGLFAFREHINSRQDSFEPNGYQIIASPNLVNESAAIFGQSTYSFTDKFRVTAGLRYSSEHKTQDGFTLFDGAFTTTTCPSPAVVVTGSVTAYGNLYPVGYCLAPNGGDLNSKDTSYKIGVEYDLAPKSLIYANVSTGYKAGGFAAGLAPNTYLPEKLTAYQIGSKNRFFNNRVQANVELFYWKYRNQQVSILQALHPAGQSAWPVNVPGWLKGVDSDFAWQISSSDRLSLSLLYAEGQYDLYPTVISSGGALGGLTDYPRINLPRYSGTLKYQHTFDLHGNGSLDFNADMHFESGAWLRPIVYAGRRPGDYRDAFQTGNVSLTWNNPAETLSITGYINNVSNAAIIGTGTSGGVSSGTFYRPATNAADARYATLDAPRTYGVRFNKSF